MGRKDTQVKIRGQRIELGEVEHHLESAIHGSYAIAAEVLRRDSQVFLVGFVALGDEYDGEDGVSPIPERTKHRLQEIVAGTAAKMVQSVPSFMIPSLFIPLRTIPLSASCKTDRKRLRVIASSLAPSDLASLSAARPTGDSTRPSERSRVERRMRGLWASVLGVDATAVAAGASFFAQGGDSVLAIKLVAACRSAGLVVSVADLLRNPTLESLCETLGSDVKEEEPLKVYEPLSTLGPLNHAAFVENIICPQIKTTSANIEDIVEATTSQASFVASGLLKSRGNTNYFVFQLSGACDAAALEDACRGLVAKHPILRTAFVAFKRRVFQVVLRSLTPEFRTHQCAKWRQMHLAAKLVKLDQAEPVLLGQPIVRFLILTDSAKQSLLIMRISHAQYDGMSVPVLIDDLSALYEGQAIPERPVFTDFTHRARECNEDGAEDYWCHLLEGSSMTNIISHKTPPYQNAKLKTVSREIPTPRPQSHNMTFANMAKAAWALVLAEMSSSTDVVFGHLVSGRNLSVGRGADVNEILGPCLNLVPVRVRLAPGTTSTTQQVLRQIHDQQLAAIPYETFGLDQIIDRCTDWPLWTRFSSIVQHQNLDGVEDVLQGAFRFGSAQARFAAFQGQQDTTDVLVLSTPKSDGARVDVTLHFSPKVVGLDVAEDMLDRLLANIDLLARPDQDLAPHVQHWLAAPPQLPMLARHPAGADASLRADAAAIAAGYRFERVPAVARDLVTQAWRHVLEPAPGQAVAADEAAVDPNATCWYNVWGHLVAAAQLAEFYTAQLAATSVTVVHMEDMVDHPTMLAQALLLAERLGVPVVPDAPVAVAGEKEKEKVARKERRGTRLGRGLFGGKKVAAGRDVRVVEMEVVDEERESGSEGEYGLGIRREYAGAWGPAQRDVVEVEVGKKKMRRSILLLGRGKMGSKIRV